MINLNLNLALKTIEKISKLWNWKSKTVLVGLALIVSCSACLNKIVYKQNLPYNSNRGFYVK